MIEKIKKENKNKVVNYIIHNYIFVFFLYFFLSLFPPYGSVYCFKFKIYDVPFRKSHQTRRNLLTLWFGIIFTIKLRFWFQILSSYLWTFWSMNWWTHLITILIYNSCNRLLMKYIISACFVSRDELSTKYFNWPVIKY